MNRADLQKLSEARLREARVLFAASEYAGAYYLAGYAVECALKSAFAKSVQRYDFPGKKIRDVFVHDITKLIALAGLKDQLEIARKANPTFAAGWDVVCKWSEESRYSTLLMKRDAEELLEAIVRRKDGVLPWIKQRW